MKINDNLGPEHAAIVARDRAIIAREKARPSIQTRDAKFYTGTGDPLPPQVRITRKTVDSQLSWKRNGKFRDTVVSTPTPAELAAWAARMAEMSGFDGGWTTPDGNIRTSGSFAAGASAEQVQDAMKKYWDEMAEENMGTRPEVTPANDTQAAIQKMQRANDAMWKSETAHQRTAPKEWGKG
jgi:hypothetical protein